MQYHLNAIVAGIAEYVLIYLHHQLLVAAKVVHLDSAYAGIAQPSHFGTASRRAVHLVVGTAFAAVPVAIAVIPQE